MTGPQQLIEQSVHNRPDIVMLERTNKEAHLIDVAIPNSHNLAATSSRSSSPTRTAKKSMATESSLYSTIRFIHNGDHSKKLYNSFNC
jgi:hypothetical protein